MKLKRKIKLKLKKKSPKTIMGRNVKDLGISLFIAIVKFKVLSVYVNVKEWSWKSNNYKIKKK